MSSFYTGRETGFVTSDQFSVALWNFVPRAPFGVSRVVSLNSSIQKLSLMVVAWSTWDRTVSPVGSHFILSQSPPRPGEAVGQFL